MLSEFYFEWEASLILAFQSVLGRSGTAVMSLVTEFGGEAVLFLILGVIYWGYDKELGEKIGLNLLTSIVLCPILKNCLLRLRPYFIVPGVKCLKPVEAGDIMDVTIQGYSFPSSHSGSAASVYGTIAFYSGKRSVRILCALITAAVGISRFCLGVHFPTDVIAGILIGTALILITEYARKKNVSRKVLYGFIMGCGAVGMFFRTTEDYYTAYGVLVGGLCGLLYEQNRVRFRNTASLSVALLRTAGGIAAFLLVSLVLKTVFNTLELAGTAQLLIRTLRYAASAFTAVGVYPSVFRFEKTSDNSR